MFIKRATHSSDYKILSNVSPKYDKQIPIQLANAHSEQYKYIILAIIMERGTSLNDILIAFHL
jgi:hypothetical protein